MSDSRRAASAWGGWVMVSAAVGAVVGLCWTFVAPRVEYRVAGGQLLRTSTQPEEFFGADLVLGGLLALAGLVLAVVWAVRGRPSPLGSLGGLLAGGVVAGAIAAWLGAYLTGVELSSEGLADGELITSGLRLRSWAMLVWWPTVVAVVFAVALAGSVDKERAAAVADEAEAPAT